jgi:hypothetical protein
MKCRQYIFLLTSDQLAQASYMQALEAGVHRWVCHQCRRFTRNDELLLELLAQQHEAQLQGLTPPDKS